jgi:hypothetical protein
VDLLKLDIEGAELEVLREAKDRLDQVREIRMEIHQTSEEPAMCEEICRILEVAGFVCEVTERPLKTLLPVEAHPWFERCSPRLFLLQGRRD